MIQRSLKARWKDLQEPPPIMHMCMVQLQVHSQHTSGKVAWQQDTDRRWFLVVPAGGWEGGAEGFEGNGHGGWSGGRGAGPPRTGSGFGGMEGIPAGAIMGGPAVGPGQMLVLAPGM